MGFISLKFNFGCEVENGLRGGNWKQETIERPRLSPWFRGVPWEQRRPASVDCRVSVSLLPIKAEWPPLLLAVDTLIILFLISLFIWE